MVKRVVQAVLAIFFIALAQAHGAGSSSSTIAVSAWIEGSCTVMAAPLIFPTIYGSTIADDLIEMTSITVECANGLAHEIDFDNGQNPHPVNGNPTLAEGTINYHLALEPSFTVRWTDYYGSPGTILSGEGINVPTPHDVWGHIPGGQPVTVAPGTYTDTVTVTVSW